LKPDQVERADYDYWYWQFNTQTSYEVLQNIPEALLARLVELRETLMCDSHVASVEPED
jgi:hypothetical protein